MKHSFYLSKYENKSSPENARNLSIDDFVERIIQDIRRLIEREKKIHGAQCNHHNHENQQIRCVKEGKAEY